MSDRIRRRDDHAEFFPRSFAFWGRVTVELLYTFSFRVFFICTCVSRFVVSCLNVSLSLSLSLFFAFIDLSMCAKIRYIYKLFVVG